jgi:hypothetical protein
MIEGKNWSSCTEGIDLQEEAESPQHGGHDAVYLVRPSVHKKIDIEGLFKFRYIYTLKKHLNTYEYR